MKLDQKNIFLFDGIGAVLSASLMFLLIAQFESFFGLPQKSAYFLTIFPVLYLIFSFYCHFNPSDSWKANLKGVISANLLYCFISIGVFMYHVDVLTPYGLTYFVLEILVVIGVVVMELRVLRGKVVN